MSKVSARIPRVEPRLRQVGDPARDVRLEVLEQRRIFARAHGLDDPLLRQIDQADVAAPEVRHVEEIAPQRQSGGRVGHVDGRADQRVGEVDHRDLIAAFQRDVSRLVAVGDDAVGHHAAQLDRGDDFVRVQVDDRERAVAVIGDQRPRPVRRHRHRARVFADRDFGDHPVERREQDRHRVVDHVGGDQRPPIARQRDGVAGIRAVDARVRQREDRQRRRRRQHCLRRRRAARPAAG